MDYYINIQIKSDTEMRKNVLLNKIYTKFHKALFTIKSVEIGVSFPSYKVILGDVIRIHGSHKKLIEFQNLNWLEGLTSYCDVSDILVIPKNIKYRNISRKQANMTESKLRRLIKRKSISQEEAKCYRAKMFQQGLECPYLELESSSNGNKHRRYLQFSELLDESIEGEFDQFGLSKKATIPWF